MKARTLSRRTLLRGAGSIAIALPWLEAMTPRTARAAEAPRRFVVWHEGVGTHIPNWLPSGGETDFTLSPILKPLERHKKDLIVLQGLMGAHMHGHSLMASILTARPTVGRDGGPASGSDYANHASGVSIDQHIVQRLELGKRTKIPSLQLGVNDATDIVLNWTGAHQPLPAQSNPYAVFKQLFSDLVGGDPRETDRLRARRQSILDSVTSNAATFSGKLGVEDKRKVDAHLEAIRQIERTIDDPRQAPGATCKKPELGAQIDWEDDDNAPLLGKLQMELLAMALACDLTRVATLKWNSGGGQVGKQRHDRNHRWIPGGQGGWHGVTHAWKSSADAVTKIEAWYNEQLAFLLDRLAAVDEGGRRLLDNLVVLCTNEHGFGTEDWVWSHYARCMPYLLVGSCGGAFKTGRNLAYGDMTKVPARQAGAVYTGGPMTGQSPDTTVVNWATSDRPYSSQLFVSIMNAMGVPGDEFGAPPTRGPEGQTIPDRLTKGPLPRLGG